MWLLILCAAVIALAVFYFKKKNQFWTNLGIPQGNPSLIFGDSFKMVFRLQSVPEMIEDWYTKVDTKARYVGVYRFTTPILVVRDLELVKQLLVKEFDHFTDHLGIIPGDAEPLFGKNIFSLTGTKWRDMRSTLSPVFTSSKMKFLFSLISQMGKQFTNYFLEQKEEVISLEMKHTFAKFANDVIANVVFGIECNSLKNPDNEFYVMGQEVTNFDKPRKVIKFFVYLFSQTIYKLLKLRLFSAEMVDFFSNLVHQNISAREQNNIVRPDLIHLLMQAKKHRLEHDEFSTLPEAGFASVEESDINKKRREIELTDDDVIAQAFIFFLGGFETVSTQMSFLSYELALNPDIQERLRQEIFATRDICQNNLTYEALMNMKYMDMVVTESLRKWPNSVALDRVCTKSFTIDPKLPEEKPLYLEKDSLFVVPLYGIHRNPEYYPDPERFDPERFNDENKKNIQPYSYLPFGLGPRSCLGNRFALLEVKSFFYYFLASFEIVPVEKTQVPLVFCKKTIAMTGEKGFWLGFQRVTKKKIK